MCFQISALTVILVELLYLSEFQFLHEIKKKKQGLQYPFSVVSSKIEDCLPYKGLHLLILSQKYMKNHVKEGKKFKK